MKKFILIGLTTLITSVVMASTTFTGQTGLTLMPTAEVAPVDTFNVAVGYYNTGAKYPVYPVRANYGLTENCEIGFNYQVNANMYGATYKWKTAPGYAVGVSVNNIGFKKQFEYGVYGAVTKKLPLKLDDVSAKLNGTLGIRVIDEKTQINPAVGIDATIGNAEKLGISAEYLFRTSDYAYKASYQLSDDFGIQAGLAKESFTFTDKLRIFAGVNYTYDLSE